MQRAIYWRFLQKSTDFTMIFLRMIVLEVKVCFFSPPNTHLITEGKNSFAVSADFGPKPHFFPALQSKKRALEIRKPVRSLQKASIAIKSRQKQPDLDRFTNKSRLLHRSPALSFLFSVKDYKYQGQDRIKKKTP